MLSARVLRDTITVYVRTFPGGSGSGETDRYGNAVAHEASGVEYPAHVEPLRLPSEALNGQDRRENDISVLLAPDAPLDGVSRFDWNDSSYEVQGEPNVVMRRTETHHQQIIGRKIVGG